MSNSAQIVHTTTGNIKGAVGTAETQATPYTEILTPTERSKTSLETVAEEANNMIQSMKKTMTATTIETLNLRASRKSLPPPRLRAP